MKQYILMFLSIFLLSSCGWFTSAISLEPKPELKIEKLEPVRLYPVDWKIMVIENVPYYAVSEDGFKNLSKNSEILQNRLLIDQQIISETQKYYSK